MMVKDKTTHASRTYPTVNVMSKASEIQQATLVQPSLLIESIDGPTHCIRARTSLDAEPLSMRT